jgi:AmmeMemoRadiSam system protein B
MERQAAVAGTFYPADRQQLQRVVAGILASVSIDPDRPAPKAIIAPHAGYKFSGPIAGNAYAHLVKVRQHIRRVLLLGPAHWVPVRSLAARSADVFRTPMGDIQVDVEAVEEIIPFSQVSVSDAAHNPEHSLEVHLPFLQTVLDDFKLVPLVVGQATADDVSEILELLWGGSETVIVVSSDLSHFNNYEQANKIDLATAQRIESLKPVRTEQACGSKAINGLLNNARKHQMVAETLDLRNSGDTSDSLDRVVGYGAFGFWEQQPSP